LVLGPPRPQDIDDQRITAHQIIKSPSGYTYETKYLQVVNQVGRCLFFNFCDFFMAFLCVSQQGEFKNTIKTFWGSPCQKLLAEKVEKKLFFSCRLSPS
jgi:hypothetical protein